MDLFQLSVSCSFRSLPFQSMMLLCNVVNGSMGIITRFVCLFGSTGKVFAVNHEDGCAKLLLLPARRLVTFLGFAPLHTRAQLTLRRHDSMEALFFNASISQEIAMRINS